MLYFVCFCCARALTNVFFGDTILVRIETSPEDKVTTSPSFVLTLSLNFSSTPNTAAS